MSNLEEILKLDATAQAALIRSKEIKSLDLVETAIEQVEKVNPVLNLVITTLFDQARTDATGKIPDGPFAGVPFLMKDIGTFDAPESNPMQAWKRVVAFAPFTAAFNATGQPAMSVPLYWNGDNLPVGTHFIGRFGDEATLFRLAAQLEEARPWAARKPPVCA